MARVNYAKYVILGMLSGGPMTGYEMRRWAKELLGYVWDIGYGQIYPALSLLERDGLATMAQEKTAGGRVRKVYSITGRGLEELRDWLRGPETKEYELILKMCFGSQLEPGELIEKLESYSRKREGEILLMEQWLRDLEGGPAFGPNTPYYLMITRLGYSYFMYEKEWCAQSIEMLKKMDKR